MRVFDLDISIELSFPRYRTWNSAAYTIVSIFLSSSGEVQGKNVAG